MRMHPLAWPVGVALALVGAGGARAAAAPPGRPVHACVALRAVPEVDGIIEADAGWAGVPDAAGTFRLPGADARLATKATRFRVGCTAKGIWFAVTCAEPDTDKIRAEHDDMGPLWEEDSIELYIEPKPGRGALHLAVNAIGSRCNDPYQGERGLLEWSAATFFGRGFWSAEIYVPYETLGAVPDPDASWGLNVCRTARTLEPAQRSSWAACRARFAEPESHGLLTFTGAGLTAADRSAVLERISARQRARAQRTDELFAIVRPEIGLQILRPGQAEDATLVRLAGPYVAPRLTPDCTRVCYQSMRGGTIGVWSVAIDNPKETRICDGEQAALAPDGTRIVLVRAGALVERDLASGKERKLTRDGASAPPSFPGWLPDGRLLYVADHRALCVIPAGGGAPVTLARGEILGTPRASPDGRRVAYPDGCHIRLLDLGSGELRQLVLGGGVQSWPLWARDSKSLCYCQTDTPDSAVYDLCRVVLDRPDTIQLVATRVAAAPDWSGTAPRVVRQTKIPSGTLRVLTGNITRSPTEALLADPGIGWQEVGRAPALGGETLIDSHAACLEFSRGTGKVALWVKTHGRPTEIAVLTIRDKTGGAARGPKTLAWRSRTPERVEIEAEFSGADGAPVHAIFAFDGPRPLLSLFPGTNLGEVRLRADLSRVATVDRLADDLLLDPSDLSADEAPLPETPMAVGFPACDPTALLLVIPGRAGQQVNVCKEPSGAQFTGFRIRPAGAPLHVAALAQATIAPGFAWARKQGTNEWHIPWPNRILGRWRVVFRSANGAPRSSTIDVGSRLDALTLPFAADDPAPANTASALYLLDRNAQTDPCILTPMDLFRDALGVAEAGRRMDERGVRECRSAEVECPFKDHEVAVRILTWIEPTEPAPAQALARFALDVTHMLRGTDSRLDEYRALFDRLDRSVAGADPTRTGSDPGWVRLGDTIRRGKALPQPATPSGAVVAAVDAIREAAAGPGRPGQNLVNELVALAEKAFPERILILGQCRRLAKDARAEAGLMMVKAPALAPLVEELRAASGGTLRHRYFQEADWRGEIPLNPEQVDYEKFNKVR